MPTHMDLCSCTCLIDDVTVDIDPWLEPSQLWLLVFLVRIDAWEFLPPIMDDWPPWFCVDTLLITELFV